MCDCDVQITEQEGIGSVSLFGLLGPSGDDVYVSANLTLLDSIE